MKKKNKERIPRGVKSSTSYMQHTVTTRSLERQHRACNQETRKIYQLCLLFGEKKIGRSQVSNS